MTNTTDNTPCIQDEYKVGIILAGCILLTICLILMILCIVLCRICYRQRARIRSLTKLVAKSKESFSASSIKKEVPENLKEIIVTNSEPTEKVWESDECVFYDLGSISRGVSQDPLEMDLVTTPSSTEKQTHYREDSNTLHVPIPGMTSGIEGDHLTKNDANANTKNNMKTDELSEKTDDVTDGNGVESKHVSTTQSLSDNLTDFSLTRRVEDSGNETLSNDDVHCPNDDDETEESVSPSSASLEMIDKKEEVKGSSLFSPSSLVEDISEDKSSVSTAQCNNDGKNDTTKLDVDTSLRLESEEKRDENKNEDAGSPLILMGEGTKKNNKEELTNEE